MFRSGTIIAGVFAAATGLAVTGSANATIFDLTNTGLDVAALTLVDNAWKLTGGTNSLNSSYPASVYADTTNGQFPVGPWVPNSAISQWDTPTNPLTQALDPTSNGTYFYTTTFTSNAATGSFIGQFAADNKVASITLNGLTIYTGPSTGNQFAGWNPFQYIDGGLNIGTNTLVFDVVNYAQNGGNPSGLNVQFTANVPEPATWAMMVLGLLTVGFLASRRGRGGSSFRFA